MGVKENFTAEEWRALLRAPMLVSYAVAGAAPSDETGYIQEMKAVADAITESEPRAAKDSLISEVIAQIFANADDDERGPTEKISVGDVRERALANCQEVAGLLQSKASPQEAEDYKRWLLVIAQRVASAAKEGGFLGFGGSQVSKSEAATLNEIAAALGLES
jgi:hypothetical protein